MQLDLGMGRITALKTEAKHLKADGAGLTHAQALEAVAHRHGARDWNTLRAQAARPIRLSPGMRASGRYLGQPFTGIVKAVQLWGPIGDRLQVTLHFDAPVDVVRFDSFSSFRQRVTAVVGPDGHSVQHTSDGTPHLVLETAST